jgi:hypothetical protein
VGASECALDTRFASNVRKCFSLQQSNYQPPAALAGSRDRGETDRARAVLLTLGGWTSPADHLIRDSGAKIRTQMPARLEGRRPCRSFHVA